MKVAVLSDIHGNLPGLLAVEQHIDTWAPDVVVVAGDIVNRGPLSRDCLDRMLERQLRDGWQLLRGNHEEFVLDCAAPDRPTSGPAYEMTQFAHWALEQLDGQATALETMADLYELPAPDGQTLRVVHASMHNNRDGIYKMTSDSELRGQIAPAPAVFVTGHTHRPLVRTVDDTLVVNVGAAGSPFDGDRRASYGQFIWDEEGWHGEVIRLDYDYAQIERDYVRSGFLTEGGPMAQLMLVELRMAHGLIFRWASRYEEDVLAEQISLEDSIRGILRDDDVRPFTGPPGWTV